MKQRCLPDHPSPNSADCVSHRNACRTAWRRPWTTSSCERRWTGSKCRCSLRRQLEIRRLNHLWSFVSKARPVITYSTSGRYSRSRFNWCITVALYHSHPLNCPRMIFVFAVLDGGKSLFRYVLITGARFVIAKTKLRLVDLVAIFVYICHTVGLEWPSEIPKCRVSRLPFVPQSIP